MAYHQKDSHSGGLVFYLTEDEKKQKQLIDDLQAMKDELAQTLAELKKTKED